MIHLIPVGEIKKELRNAKGWLDNDDPFFDELNRIVEDRTRHVLRVLKKPPPDNVPAQYKHIK